MRISDWSSDVCSSDLCQIIDLVRAERGRERVLDVLRRRRQFGERRDADLTQGADIRLQRQHHAARGHLLRAEQDDPVLVVAEERAGLSELAQRLVHCYALSATTLPPYLWMSRGLRVAGRRFHP